MTPELSLEDRVTALEARVAALQVALLPLTRVWYWRWWWIATGR